MPTYEAEARFWQDWSRLSEADQDRFTTARRKLVYDLKAGQGFRKSLRVKGVQGAPGAYEMTWAPDGRATFQYGPEVLPGEPHIIWRRIGGHDILNQP